MYSFTIIRSRANIMDGRSEYEIYSSVRLCIYTTAIVALGMTVICENMLWSRQRLWNIWQYFGRWCWSLGFQLQFVGPSMKNLVLLFCHGYSMSRALHCLSKKTSVRTCRLRPFVFCCAIRLMILPSNLGNSSEISRMKKDTYFGTFFQTLTTENNSRPCSDLAALHPKSVSVTSYLLPRSQRWRLFLLLCAVPLLGLRLHFQLLRPPVRQKKMGKLVAPRHKWQV